MLGWRGGKPVTEELKQLVAEDERTGLTQEALKRALRNKLVFHQGKSPRIATRNDSYMALAYTVRDRLIERWISTLETYSEKDSRIVCYLSAEFLMGPHLANSLINLGIFDEIRKAVEDLGLNLDELIEQEEEGGILRKRVRKLDVAGWKCGARSAECRIVDG